MTPVEQLRTLRTYITPELWVNGPTIKTEKRCIVNRMSDFYGWDWGSAEEFLHAALPEGIARNRLGSLVDFNDSSSVEDVQALVDRAIQLAEAANAR